MIKSSEFARRQRILMNSIGMESIAIVPAAPESVRNRDVLHEYRQDSDFWYLTGFVEPEAVAVFIPGREQGEYILFCREKNQEKEIWDGYRAGQEGAIQEYGADDSFPIDDIDDILPRMMENRERVFYNMGFHQEFDKHMMEWLNRVRAHARSGVRAPNEFVSLDHLLHDARLYKSRSEISVMRQAAKVSARAHKKAMAMCKPGVMEYQVEAALLHEFKHHGMTTAYPSIVGGGKNACVLHYISNRDELRDGDLLLIDAGAEHQGYASDITRTFPVNGEFTSAQKEVYEVVLESQLAAIEATQPGNHWNDPHDAAVKILTKGLIDLGLIKGPLRTALKDASYRRFYMHRTGHWLGMDVHDVGDYKIDEQWRLLEPGMVTTVEPGLYIQADRDIPKALHNIGVRIEDDVAVTKQGYDVLSKDAPKTVEAIEGLVGSDAG